MRRVIVALVALGLALGVYVLWPESTSDDPNPPDATETTTTTERLETTTSAAVGTTTTTTEDSHVVTTVEEAEEILREFWFDWFSGIHNSDTDAIRLIVLSDAMVQSAQEGFDEEFARDPLPSDFSFADTEILRGDDECLAVWNELELSGFREGTADGVKVFRWHESRWKLLSIWSFRDDLWESDCDSSL